MSASVPYSERDLAESVATFAEKITPAMDRWNYCFSRATHPHRDKYGDRRLLNIRTIPVCARLLGRDKGHVQSALGRIMHGGLDGAVECVRGMFDKYQGAIKGFHPDQYFHVGPMQAWQVGHLYFARIVNHPHVVKIGFSRRVRERLEDIASKSKANIVLRPGELRVGTLADEHWWHKNWESYRISGEWFFDPRMSERTLPAFLAPVEQAEAA